MLLELQGRMGRKKKKKKKKLASNSKYQEIHRHRVSESERRRRIKWQEALEHVTENGQKEIRLEK